MTLPTHRQSYTIILTSTIGLMSYGLYTQYFQGLEPCPLCMTQRFFYCLIGAFALLGLIHNPQAIGNKIYGALMAISSIGGIATAGRQVWMQHLPPRAGAGLRPQPGVHVRVIPLCPDTKNALHGRWQLR